MKDHPKNKIIQKPIIDLLVTQETNPIRQCLVNMDANPMSIGKQFMRRCSTTE